MTKEQLKILSDSIGVRNDVFDVWYPYFQKHLSSNGINTPKRLLAFFAQIGQESGKFYWTEEINKTTCQGYDGGCKYLGRGLIQLTHYGNYAAFKKRYGVDVVGNPSLLGGANALVATPAQLKNSLLSATFFWEKAKLNELADQLDLSKSINEEPNNSVYKCIGRKINRGSCGSSPANGESDRLNNFEKLRQAYIKNKAKFKGLGSGIGNPLGMGGSAAMKIVTPVAIGVGVVGAIILTVYLYKRYKNKK